MRIRFIQGQRPQSQGFALRPAMLSSAPRSRRCPSKPARAPLKPRPPNTDRDKRWHTTVTAASPVSRSPQRSLFESGGSALGRPPEGAATPAQPQRSLRAPRFGDPAEHRQTITQRGLSPPRGGSQRALCHPPALGCRLGRGAESLSGPSIRGCALAGRCGWAPGGRAGRFGTLRGAFVPK